MRPTPRLASVLSALMVLGLAAEQAWAQAACVPDRVALLIANWDYGSYSAPNVKERVSELAAALAGAGFVVSVEENVSDLAQTIDRFSATCPTGGVALFYFAGLGHRYELELDELGEIDEVGESGVRDGAPGRMNSDSGIVGVGAAAPLSLRSLAQGFGARCTARLQMLFFDCAEPAPDTSPDARGLLADQGPWPGALICYAMPPGTALAPGQHSLLAGSLARHLTTEGQGIGSAMASIRADVLQQSAGKQEIWFRLGTPKDSSAQVIPAQLRKISTGPLPPANPEPGDEWISAMGMVFCWCPAGGRSLDPADDGRSLKRELEGTNGSITNGFWISKYELTKGERERVGNQAYANTQTEFGNMPWAAGSFAIKFFVERLDDAETKEGRKPEGWTYRLPTEAEWQYACLAGSQTKYSFGDSAAELHLYGNYADSSLHRDDDSFYYCDLERDDGVGFALAPVGSYRPNAWGVHDMHGNLSEYVDGYKVHRGGSWCSTSEYCLAGFRNTTPSETRAFTGARIVLVREAPGTDR